MSAPVKEMTPGEMEEAKRLLNLVADAEQLKDQHRRARVGVAFRLGLDKIVASTCKERGWPMDEDFVVVLAVAVGLFMQGAYGQRLRRPLACDAPVLANRWPKPSLYVTAKAIVDTFDLGGIDPQMPTQQAVSVVAIEDD